MSFISNYQRLIIFVFVFFMSVCPLFALQKDSCQELILYQNTLLPSSKETYNKALMKYKQIETDSVLFNLKTSKSLEVYKMSKSFMRAFWGDPVDYTSAFILALELENALGNITEDEYPYKRADYVHIGEAYYLFNEFEQSAFLLKKAITDKPPCLFADYANLEARRIIGICYANIGKMDSSNYYFRSILKSPDVVLSRPLYNAYALSYLGCNAMLEKEYDKALALDDEALLYFRNYTDYGHLAGMYYCRFRIYLEQGNLTNAGLAADSVLYYARKDTYNPAKRYKQAFSALQSYYAAVGDAAKTKAYGDSLINVYKKDEDLHTSQYIANAHQIVKDREIRLVQSTALSFRRNLFVGVIILVIVIIIAGYIFLQYRNLRIAYKILAEKSNQWAGLVSGNYKKNMSLSATSEEVELMDLIHDYVIVRKKYLESGLSLERMAKDLNINRSYLSSAINNVTEKNFNTYINEYRIAESINWMNDIDKENVSIDDIYLSCGFNNKRSFYNYFKQITGITPGQYRDSRKGK